MPINDLRARQERARPEARHGASIEESTAETDLDSIYAAKIGAWRAAIDPPGEGLPASAAPAIEH